MLRALRALADLGVPHVATPGPGGGYALARDQRLAPLALTAGEARGLLMSYEASDVEWYATHLLPLGVDALVGSLSELIATIRGQAAAIVALYPEHGDHPSMS